MDKQFLSVPLPLSSLREIAYNLIEFIAHIGKSDFPYTMYLDNLSRCPALYPRQGCLARYPLIFGQLKLRRYPQS
jgi:hypothetical protein